MGILLTVNKSQILVSSVQCPVSSLAICLGICMELVPAMERMQIVVQKGMWLAYSVQYSLYNTVYSALCNASIKYIVQSTEYSL